MVVGKLSAAKTHENLVADKQIKVFKTVIKYEWPTRRIASGGRAGKREKEPVHYLSITGKFTSIFGSENG